MTLAEALAEIVQAEVTGLYQLSAGSSRQTWSFDAGGRGYILRRDPPAVPNPDGMAREAECFRAAVEAGVPVPELLATGDGSDAIGSPYLLMERLVGETLPQRLLRDERWADVRPLLAREFGQILARIHAIAVRHVLAVPSYQDRLSWLRDWYDTFDEPSPALELAMRWLAEHRPAPVPQSLVHGDFRNGNLLIGQDGVRAVLDWELAHIGDPREDLGWMCAKVWRFGAKPAVGGFGEREELFDGYAQVAGQRPDPAAVHWWEVFAAVHWAVICRAQAQRHLSGAEPSVELAVLGRRSAEAEHDALLALGLTEPALVDDPITLATTEPGVHGRPTVDELLDAVAGFLDEAVPTDDGRSRYLAKVAANALTIARRELRIGDEQRSRHREHLAALGCRDERELTRRIRSGALDTGSAALVAAVRAMTTDRVLVANPKYLHAPG
ncbi:MAG: phosphotransferase [Actinophytocola sp.]|nr:phosphotransferase [Actinophytocola sp.]